MSYKNNNDYQQYLEMFKYVDIGYLKNEYDKPMGEVLNINLMARYLAIRDTLIENKIIMNRRNK